MRRVHPAFLPAALLLFLSLYTACKPGVKLHPSPKETSALLEADRKFMEGSQASLIAARIIYGRLLTSLPLEAECREKLFKTLLLLALRTKEMGILENPFIKEASELVKTFPNPSGPQNLLMVTRAVRTNFKGMSGEDYESNDLTFEQYFEWGIKEQIGLLNQQLQQQSSTSPFAAYFYLALNESFPHLIKQEVETSIIDSVYSETPLVLFKRAQVPKLDEGFLLKIKDAVPDIHEADLFLGELSLVKGKLGIGEKFFLSALEHFPESTSCLLGLTRIYFAIEEYSRCIETYDKILDLMPRYREALLGKAVCFSYLGESDEAMNLCRTLQNLGTYYQGESHYWMAWNLQQTGRYEEARFHIEEAKKYLIGNYERLLLSGLVNYELKRPADAEQELLDVLKIRRQDIEASFYLGRIYAEIGRWPESGRYFETAAVGCGLYEDEIQKKIREIAVFDFSIDRKDQMLRRQKNLKKRTSLKKATAYYNAAAGYHNAGMNKQALKAASLASAHPSFQNLARELIDKIEK